jgi:hypothetical protein
VNRFAGCGANDVLDALSGAALFPKELAGMQGCLIPDIPAHDFLVILDHEITVAVLIRDDIVNRRKVSIFRWWASS